MLVSNYPNVSINTANPPTEMARRDAARRDLFVPVTEAEKSSPEKPAASDERARAAASQAAVNLYDASGKETETQQAIEGRDERQPDQQQEGNAERDPEQSQQQDAKRQEAKRQEAKQQQAEQQEQRQIDELQSRDREVKTHEQAHAAVGGRYAGAPSYSYELGPDGKQYAVGGEVQIDISPVAGDPQATVQKMQQVRAAALAPAEPSAADRRIAAEAAQRQVQAQAELVQQNAPTNDQGGSELKINATTADSSGVSQTQSSGFAPQSEETGISYRQSDDSSSAIVYPQRDTLASVAQMQLRRNVIAGFYQRATEPVIKQSLQQA
uniref:SrpA-related protein n=1 Tax=Rheinheimera sp. BAL341 TaxID=1708203 RepID=A0A486XTP8_9GAMM